MSYSDYLDGLKDGVSIGFSVGLEVGWRAGRRSGFLSGYQKGYSDASYGLPYKPLERLRSYEKLIPDPPKVKITCICKPDPLPVFEYKPPKSLIPEPAKIDIQKFLNPEMPKYKPPKHMLPEPPKIDLQKILNPEPIKMSSSFMDIKPKKPWEF